MTTYKIEAYGGIFDRTPLVSFTIPAEDFEEACTFADEIRENYHAVYTQITECVKARHR